VLKIKGHYYKQRRRKSALVLRLIISDKS